MVAFFATEDGEWFAQSHLFLVNSPIQFMIKTILLIIFPNHETNSGKITLVVSEYYFTADF